MNFGVHECSAIADNSLVKDSLQSPNWLWMNHEIRECWRLFSRLDDSKWKRLKVFTLNRVTKETFSSAAESSEIVAVAIFKHFIPISFRFVLSRWIIFPLSLLFSREWNKPRPRGRGRNGNICNNSFHAVFGTREDTSTSVYSVEWFSCENISFPVSIQSVQDFIFIFAINAHLAFEVHLQFCFCPDEFVFLSTRLKIFYQPSMFRSKVFEWFWAGDFLSSRLPCAAFVKINYKWL